VNERTDQELLRDYAGRRSEAAFAELVRRHIDFIYSAAVRMVRDGPLAEDVTQGVFLALAQNAGRLSDRPVLSGWLHRTAQNLASTAVRSELRRRTREQEAAAMNEFLSVEPNTLWEQIAPHLDAALGQLSEADRDAVLLRYFERKSAREMAQILGTSETAAQKRVNRAVERLRTFFARRRISIGACGLGVVIPANAIHGAPVGLAMTVSTTVLARVTIATTVAGTAITMTTLQKTLIAALIVAGVATPLVLQHQTQTRLRQENQSLRQRVDELSSAVAQTEEPKEFSNKHSPAPQLPAPKAHLGVPPTGSLDSQSNAVMAWILRDGRNPPQVVADQLASYLDENGRSAASLLAAFRITGDQTLLEEAMQKYPRDPQVSLVAACKGNVSPEERRQALEAFKQSAPGNALANYLSAREFFKSGQIDQAVYELSAADRKGQFQDYFMDFDQNDEEAFRAAGYSVAEAKIFPGYTLLRSHVWELEKLGHDMVSLAGAYRQAGDEPSAQTILQMALDLSRRFDGTPSEPYPSLKARLAIESIALAGMDPAGFYGDVGQTVHDRLNELAQQREMADELERRADEFSLRRKVPDQDWITYKDRWRAFGEHAALQWLVSKYGQN
jgi:RNA polymerase sigma factor (sigma-70 family)